MSGKGEGGGRRHLCEQERIGDSVLLRRRPARKQSAGVERKPGVEPGVDVDRAAAQDGAAHLSSAGRTHPKSERRSEWREDIVKRW